ncbi:uncharacterized protein LOC134280104 [Saccostrea cucullata]|uniref:uncharacterized protein LOC134280104 n=1 Tax=Saccostrea cuccullata TaxID=36930 RepID=UPI002ED58DE2
MKNRRGKLNFIFIYATLAALVHSQNSESHVGVNLNVDQSGIFEVGATLEHKIQHKDTSSSVSVSASVNSAGGWGVGFSFNKEFKRSTDDTKFEKHTGRYVVWILANQCNFRTYDQNGDNLISLDEMKALFVYPEFGIKLYKDLNSNNGERGITEHDFNMNTPHVIKGCDFNNAVANVRPTIEQIRQNTKQIWDIISSKNITESG